MKVNIARYYKQERLKLDCEIITPMFLGNSTQEAELRAAPFKGLLRYWWRVAEGDCYNTPESLLTAEDALFGSADADSGGKSKIAVEVNGQLKCYASGAFPAGQKIPHPEVKNKHGIIVSIDRFLYLGYGPIIHGGELKKEGRGAFQTGQFFRITISGAEQILEDLHDTLHCLQQFGAIGSRSRNGWGSFSLSSNQLPAVTDLEIFHKLETSWVDCYDRDYPHRLGSDGNKLLLWRCSNSKNDWQGVMNELAEIYMNIRLDHHFVGGGKDNPHKTPQNRHLLGYPAGMNHSVKGWGNNGRHGSSLRLLVRKEAEGHRGYILHLPHLFSKKMWPGEKERQINIWQSVHKKLDTLCERVSFQEASK